MNQKFIIGGGIAGLIFSYYNPDYVIIDDNIGGQMGDSFPIGPRYLQDEDISRNFLKNLNVKFVPAIIKVGYKDGLLIKNDCNLITRQNYFMKSRNVNSLEGFNATVMNSNKNSMSVLLISFPELIQKITGQIKNKIINGRVKNIDTIKQKIIINENNEEKIYDYEKLVSTIPLNILLKILNKNNDDYKSIGITYCLVKKNFFNVNDYGFIYCSNEEPYHRISVNNQGLTFEFAKFITEDELKNIFKDDYIDCKYFNNIQIVSGNKMDELDGIKLFGRYGSWDRRYTTEKLIKEALEMNYIEK